MKCRKTPAVITSAMLGPPAAQTHYVQDHAIPSTAVLAAWKNDYTADRTPSSRSLRRETESTKRGGTNSIPHTPAAASHSNDRPTRRRADDNRASTGSRSKGSSNGAAAAKAAAARPGYNSRLALVCTHTHTCSGAPSAGTSSAPVKKSPSPSMFGNPRSQKVSGARES